MAGAPGFEPGITGPKPVALPLGHAPAQGKGSLPAHRLVAHASAGRAAAPRGTAPPARRRRRAATTNNAAASTGTSTTISCDTAAVHVTTRTSALSCSRPQATYPATAPTAATRRATSGITPASTRIALDGGNRERDLDAAGTQAPREATLAVLDDDLARHEMKVSARLQRPRPRALASSAAAACRGLGRGREEPVDDRPGAAHVGTKRPDAAQLVRER